MLINPSIFKAYDVRGVYPLDINEEVAFNIGRALIKISGAKNVVVGHDARLSSLNLFKALVRGISKEGAQIYSIGQTLTECLYFALKNYNCDAGVMVTASHNPKEYNGFKVIKKSGNSIEIIKGTKLSSFVDESVKDDGINIEFEKKDIWPDFINHVLSFVDLGSIVPAKIVVDASNGVAGLAVSKIKDNLPIEIIPLNFDPDGNFPNHGPNPLEKGSTNLAGAAIKDNKADFGFIFDGDADRVFLLDEKGEMVRADATLLLLAKYFLEKNPGAAVAYNVICSKAVPEFITKWGGRPIRTPVGFVNVRDGLLKNQGIMGGELAGHYCFKDNFYMDSGIISFLILLQVISKDSRKLSEVVAEVSPYPKGSEINFSVEDKSSMMEKVKEKYSDGKQDFLDGVTVEYKDWWFNVRPSNTEPLLRLTIEADTKEILEAKQKELTKLIGS